MAYVTVDAGEFSYQVWVDDPVPPASNPQVPPPPPPPPSPASVDRAPEPLPASGSTATLNAASTTDTVDISAVIRGEVGSGPQVQGYLNLILNKYSAEDLARAYPEYGNVRDYEVAKNGLPQGLVVPGSLDAEGRLQFVQGTPEFFEASQIATQAARDAVRRAAIANGLGGPDGKDVIATTGTGPDGRVYLTTNRGDIDITEYFQGLPRQPVPISIAVESGATIQVDTGFRKVEILAPTPTNQVVNTKEGTVTFGPDSELAKFIQWQGSQPNPVGPGTIADLWAIQGISDPYSNPSIVGTAVEVTNRAGGREEPWNDKNWPAYQGSTKDSFNSAVQARTNPAEYNKLLAETGWDRATANSWIERILEPEKWAAARAEEDRRNGVVVGGGFVTGPTRIGSNPTNQTSTNTVNTVAINPTSTAYTAAAAAAATTQQALNTFVRANPSNLVRRRAGQQLLTPAQDAARTETINKLNTTVETLNAETVAAAIPVVVSETVTVNTGSGEANNTTASASLPTTVNYLNDAALTNQTELQLAPIIGAAAIVTAAVTTTTVLPPPVDETTPQISTVLPPPVDETATKIGTVLLLSATLAKDQPVTNAGGYPNVDGQNFGEILNPETGTYDVWNLDTGRLVTTGLDQAEAEAFAQDLAVKGIALNTSEPVVFTPGTPTNQAFVTAFDPETQTYGVWDQRTGSFIQTGLSKDNADAITADAIDNDPAGGELNVDSAVVETTGTPTQGNQYVSTFDPETQTYGVWDNTTGTFVKTGLSEAEANVSAFEEQSQADAELAISEQPDPSITTGYNGERYVAVESDETGGWGVFDNETGQFVSTGLSESDARVAAFEDQSLYDAQQNDLNNISTDLPQNLIAGTPADQAGGRYIVTQDDDGTYAVYDNKTGSYVSQGLTETEALDQAATFNADDVANVQGPDAGGENPFETNQQSTLAEAQQQATLQAQDKFSDNGDWRVKLSLAPGADYLYNSPQGNDGQGTAGILQPLQETDGVIFPYTPQIDTNYKADYDTVGLTHSNYKSYFYKSSSVEAVTLQATFTAQDTQEANYLLAVIHFFKSVTKMFYGQDGQRGTPPPLVYLTGLGEYQFNGHPCVVTNFTYSLPKDVDYIRTRGININGADLLSRRARQSAATNSFSSSAGRLKNLFSSQGITKYAEVSWTPTPPTLGLNQPTYVPVKMDMNISLLPIQSRAQVSQQFSVKNYANGNLLRGGFW